jgi:hypothetical protein
MARKLTAKEMLELFKSNMRTLSQEELLDVVGYSYMRVIELEMLFDVLLEKEVITKEDFDKRISKFEGKALDKFKALAKRKKFQV